ncbi:MAG: radical SAM family heme chaperone HemW [Deltaproteobacteria bacterium]|nr:radical SAM family heme chaperone HemW [Deltaproteobacteria bacterium]
MITKFAKGLSKKTVGLYVHFPFCSLRCPYCDFPVVVGKADDAYLKELKKELKVLESLDINIDTIYFGGGTPSACPRYLEEALNSVLKSSKATSDLEFSVESNPEDFKSPSWLAFLKHFKPRISVGVQALNDDVLSALGRRHSAKEGLEAIEKASKLGLNNINADFILGVGVCKNRHVGSEINLVANFVNHISAYYLNIEPGTFFFEKGEFKNRIASPNHLAYREISNAWEALCNFGFAQYELSNWARPGFQCVHNIKYWTHKPVLGFGVGAVSFLKVPDGGVRLFNVKSLTDYNKRQVKTAYVELLSKFDLRREKLLLDLRMCKKITLPSYTIEQLKTRNWEKIGIVELSEATLRVTRKGLFHLDYIYNVIQDALDSVPSSELEGRAMIKPFSDVEAVARPSRTSSREARKKPIASTLFLHSSAK